MKAKNKFSLCCKPLHSHFRHVYKGYLKSNSYVIDRILSRQDWWVLVTPFSQMPHMNASEEFLRPVNLHNPEEFRALQEQRVLCGWNYDHTVIEKWSRMMDNKQKSLFWIHEPDQDARIGHVSLDCITDPPNPDLANPDKSVMTIATFFILEQYRSHGFARQAMDILEAWAIEEPWGSPNCKAIALTTLDRRLLLRKI